MIMLRSWLCIVGLLLCHAALGIEAVSSYTIFYMPEGGKLKPYIEVYWQIIPASIGYQATDKGYQGKIETKVVLKTDTGIVAQDHYLLETPAIATTEGVKSQNIIDLHRYLLPEGKIVMEITLSDMLGKENLYYKKDSFTVEPTPTVPFYSNLQILDTSFASDKTSIFQKNDRQQIPLSANFLDDNRGKLHYYAELYRSDEIVKTEYPLVQKVFISKKALETTIYQLKRTDTITPGAIMPVLGNFDIRPLPSGNYYLNIIVEDKNKTILASRTLFFQRSNKYPLVDTSKLKAEADTTPQKVTVFDVSGTFLKKYDIGQLRAILKMILPISSAVEKDAIDNFMKRPEETYMRYFIYNFWKGRNEAEPEKAWKDYAEKVKDVNKLFGSGRQPGYETDRGMVYLKYGKPNDRVIVSNEPGSLPYEVWQYNAPGKQGRPGSFLFYKAGFTMNDYILLHSTVNGEIRNNNWRNTLYTDIINTQNKRAEQYFYNN